ncbi:hypothetical protein FQN60_003001 [Etheostoma spectabile]|uniref:Uncharacterized protein n=1 Tax=Etheostoma spectabile TaxID=54343 RepID=A0A5J5CM71_9PERO|nr:hypothetical protein FQN60_003001 [Etheostoma spectabile]
MNLGSRSLKFIILTALQALSVSVSGRDSVLSRSVEGNVWSATVQHRPTAKQKHYGITVPLQLVGQDWKPINQLKSQRHPASLKLMIEAEGEQLLLALEKNEQNIHSSAQFEFIHTHTEFETFTSRKRMH